MFFLWIFILLGIAVDGQERCRASRIDPEDRLSEVLTDAPRLDPLAGIDLMTLQTTRQLSLCQSPSGHRGRRADDRIKASTCA